MVRPVLHTRRRGAGEGHLCTRGTGMRPALMQTCCRLPVLLDPCCNTAFLISLYSREINLNPNPPVPVPVRFRHGAHIPGRPDRAEEALAQNT